MWSLVGCRHIFVVAGLIGVLAFSAPSALVLVRLPSGERFSELYVLGPGRLAEGYPFNVSEGREYLVYLGVGNHMGNAVNYELVVKMRNSSEPLPNATLGIESPLPRLYSQEMFLTDGQTLEGALDFSFSNVVFEQNVSSIGRIRVNGASIDVDKKTVWDNESNGYYYQLIMELWMYNITSSSFGFNDRFVTLWLNMTQGSAAG